MSRQQSLSLLNAQKYQYDFNQQKAYISKQRQWLNQVKKNQQNHTQSFISKKQTQAKVYDKQPTSIKVSQQQISPSNNLLQKTVKYPIQQIRPNTSTQKYVSSQKKLQNYTQLAYQKSRQLQKQTKDIILNINQIKLLEEKSIRPNFIHKICSSASRNRLQRESHSKDSKGRQSIIKDYHKPNDVHNTYNKKNIHNTNSTHHAHNTDKTYNADNQQTNRYNKYLQNSLINVNIDLRKDVLQESLGKSTNTRLKHGNQASKDNKNQYQLNTYETVYRNVNFHQFNPKIRPKSSDMQYLSGQLVLKSSHQVDHIRGFDENSLTCKETIPRQDRNLQSHKKTRSKSNLSKYSQLKQKFIEPECQLNCEQRKTIHPQKQTLSTLRKTPQKPTRQQNPPNSQRLYQKSQKKIHPLYYSSKKPSSQLKIKCQTPRQQNIIPSGFPLQSSLKYSHMLKDFSQPVGLVGERKKPIRLTINRKA